MKVWKDHFSSLERIGAIDTSSVMDIQCIRFVYLKLLREELQLTVTLWNAHHIRPSRNQASPSGKPDTMFYLSWICETMSFLKPVDIESLDVLTEILTREMPDCLPVYRDIFQSILDERGLALPSTLTQAAELLALLLDTVELEMQNMYIG